MPCIAIVEDHLLLAETLSVALRRRDIDTRVIIPDRPADLLTSLLNPRPDLVLLDLDLGRAGDGVSLVAPLKSAGVGTLVVTGMTDRLRIAAALDEGALGCQPKSSGFDALLSAACKALSGAAAPDDTERHALLAELAAHRTKRERGRALLSLLTLREQATLRALGEGFTVREISSEWVVSEATVRTFVRGVLTKLGVSSQLAAVAVARRRGWFPPEGPVRYERTEGLFSDGRASRRPGRPARRARS